MISGLDSEQLEWVTTESNNRMLIELDPELFCDVDDFLKENDCTDLSNEIIEEMDNLEKESIPMGTKYNTVAHVKKLKKFLKDNNLSDDIETIPVNFLSKYIVSPLFLLQIEV